MSLPPFLASPPRKVNRVVSKGAAAILAAAPRGSVMKVHVKGKYAARDSYDIGDVVRLSKALDAKTIKLDWLHPSNPNHDPATMNVPRSSIVRWRRDDAEVMREKGERGVAGVPHWRAHTEIRRQTSLPFREASAALTGEKALHVYLADAARKGMPIGE